MEKIQKALQKARSSRQEGAATPRTPAPRTVQAAPAPAPGPEVDHTEAAWQALRPLTVDRPRMISERIMTLEQNRNATPFDVMRTKIAQTMRTNGWRRLAITSPTPACGKSTVALNLAFSFARQTDMRMILGEMDMRRPNLAKILGDAPEVGVETVLSGTVPFAKQALRAAPNLALSLAKESVRNASELMQADSVSSVLSEIEAEYAPDLMIFDMPPMLANDDMMAFSDHIDCVLIIAGAETTTVKQVDICERELAAQTNIMGVVLNKCRFLEEEQGYYSYSA